MFFSGGNEDYTHVYNILIGDFNGLTSIEQSNIKFIDQLNIDISKLKSAITTKKSVKVETTLQPPQTTVIQPLQVVTMLQPPETVQLPIKGSVGTQTSDAEGTANTSEKLPQPSSFSFEEFLTSMKGKKLGGLDWYIPVGLGGLVFVLLLRR